MFYFICDLLGTIAFAISGVLVAMDKKLDLFGVFIIAFVTAIGGGSLRDMLVGDTPVVWMRESAYTFTIIGAVVFAILLQKRLKYLRRSLFLFDTLGIGLYTMVGIEKGLNYELMPFICIALGVITASFGGVIRDILCNEIPVIFRKEIYATACIIGGMLYLILLNTSMAEHYAYALGIIMVISIRILAVRFKIALPNIYRKNN